MSTGKARRVHSGRVHYPFASAGFGADAAAAEVVAEEVVAVEAVGVAVKAVLVGSRHCREATERLAAARVGMRATTRLVNGQAAVQQLMHYVCAETEQT